MRLIAILILTAFLQSSLGGVNFILVILLVRSLIVEDKENYILAFGLGLLLSFLTNQPLGYLSIIYLSLVKVVYLFKKTTLGNHYLVVLPVVFTLSALSQAVENILSGTSFTFSPVIIQTLLSLPLYLITKFWEERFIPAKEIKLKLGR